MFEQKFASFKHSTPAYDVHGVLMLVTPDSLKPSYFCRDSAVRTFQEFGCGPTRTKNIKVTMPPFVEVDFFALEQCFHLSTPYESSRA